MIAGIETAHGHVVDHALAQMADRFGQAGRNRAKLSSRRACRAEPGSQSNHQRLERLSEHTLTRAKVYSSKTAS
jgi:hypothetical protein